jgi:hypothetical protein
MSGQFETGMPIPNLTGFPTFIFVVDGEVAYIMVSQPSDERKIACLTSNPEIHLLEGGFPADGNLPRLDSPWPIPSNK